FGARSFQRLARFLSDGASKFLLAQGDLLRNRPQNALALKGGEASGTTEGAHCSLDGLLGMLSCRLADFRQRSSIIRRANLNRSSLFAPLSGQIKPARAD